MGVLDDFLGDALGNLWVGGRTDRKLRRLEEQGELVPATIYAIRVVQRTDADEHYYGLDLVTSAGPLRAAVRQQLIPEPWRAPLGGHVLARHLDGRINPKRLRDGTRSEAEIMAVEPVFVMGMPTGNLHVELRLHDGPDGAPRTVLRKREFVPPYAQPLAVAGARVPVAVDPKRPDHVTIDWPGAAEAAAPAR